LGLDVTPGGQTL
jgi:hypothetical protein